jgi:hypothetical protein
LHYDYLGHEMPRSGVGFPKFKLLYPPYPLNVQPNDWSGDNVGSNDWSRDNVGLNDWSKDNVGSNGWSKGNLKPNDWTRGKVRPTDRSFGIVPPNNFLINNWNEVTSSRDVTGENVTSSSDVISDYVTPSRDVIGDYVAAATASGLRVTHAQILACPFTFDHEKGGFHDQADDQRLVGIGSHPGPARCLPFEQPPSTRPSNRMGVAACMASTNPNLTISGTRRRPPDSFTVAQTSARSCGS